MKKHNIVSSIVQLSTEDMTNLPKEVLAAISRNPTLKWIKFILTDDAPNFNDQRIPKEEFANLVKTGVHMPIKMAQGFIREGHEFSVPIGSITNLIERDNFVEGIAGLWQKEFPDEIDVLQDRSSSEDKPQLSWEILYQDSNFDTDGVETFEGVMLGAATFVESPAYEGRTPVMVMASKKEAQSQNSDYKIVTEDYNNMEEKLKALESELILTRSANESLTSDLVTLQENLDAAVSEKDKLATSNEELSAFKTSIEDAQEKEARLQALTKLFSESEVRLPEDYLEDEAKREQLLAMDLNDVEFLIRDLSSFSSGEEGEVEGQEGKASRKHIGSKEETPNVDGEKSKNWTPEDIAKAMREDKRKKS